MVLQFDILCGYSDVNSENPFSSGLRICEKELVPKGLDKMAKNHI
jgi:hypothetical protein